MHQPAVRVAQIALLTGSRRLVGRLGVLTLGQADEGQSRVRIRPAIVVHRLGDQSPAAVIDAAQKSIAQRSPIGGLGWPTSCIWLTYDYTIGYEAHEECGRPDLSACMRLSRRRVIKNVPEFWASE